MFQYDKVGFLETIGMKFIEYSYEQEVQNDYLVFVLRYINEFFLEKLILEKIDANLENRSVFVESIKTIGSQDILTKNNHNYLLKMIDKIKGLLQQTVTNNNMDNQQMVLTNYYNYLY